MEIYISEDSRMVEILNKMAIYPYIHHFHGQTRTVLSERKLALNVYWDPNSPQTSSGIHICGPLQAARIKFSSFYCSKKYMTRPVSLQESDPKEMEYR